MSHGERAAGEGVDFDIPIGPFHRIVLASCRQAVRAARAAGHRVLVVGEEVAAATVAALTGADGVVLEWRGQELDVDVRGQFLVGVLCGSPDSALDAARAGAQFLGLTPPAGPVPGAELARLCEVAGVPLLAGIYGGCAGMSEVRAAGAHGCVIGRPSRKERVSGG